MHKPFPIGAFEKGLYEAKEPWLAPRNAWQQLRNGRIWRSQLLKRTGYSELGVLGYEISESSVETLGTNYYIGTLLNLPVVPGKGAYGCRFDPGDTTMELKAAGTTAPGFDILLGATLFENFVYGTTDTEVSWQVTDPDNLPICATTFSGITGAGRWFGDDGAGNIIGDDVDSSFSSVIDYESGTINFRWNTADGGVSVFCTWAETIADSQALRDTAVARPVPSGTSGTAVFSAEAMGAFIRGPRIGGTFTVTGTALSDSRDMIGTITTDDSTHPFYDFTGVDIASGSVNVETGWMSVTFIENTTTVPVCDYVRTAGYVAHATGAYQLLFWEDTSSDVDAYYEYVAGNPITGIHSWTDADRAERFLVCDTRRSWLWNGNEERFDSLSASDLWSGNESDLFWFTDWDDLVVLNNGLDAPHKYNPTIGPPTIVEMDTNYDASGGNDIAAARFAVRYKGVLVYFATTESGSLQGARARWTQIGNPEAWRDAIDYQDAATNEVAQSAHFLGDQLYVQFERSWWTLLETGDPEGLLRWEKVPAEWGATGKLASVATSEVIYSRTPYGVIGFDGQGQLRVDEDIPDITLPWNPQEADRSQFIRKDEDRQMWLSYAGSSEENPSHVLVLQMDERRARSWSIYDLPFNVYGAYLDVGGTKVWDDYDDLWDNYVAPWDAREFQSGRAIIVGGSLDGYVYAFDSTNSDDGAEIDFQARSMRLNPYPQQRVHLAWIDFWITADTTGDIEVKLYPDYNAAAYFSTTIELASPNEKVMRRVLVNHSATWHVIELRSRQVSRLSVDLVVPFFKPVGGVRPIA